MTVLLGSGGEIFQGPWPRARRRFLSPAPGAQPRARRVSASRCVSRSCRCAPPRRPRGWTTGLSAFMTGWSRWAWRRPRRRRWPVSSALRASRGSSLANGRARPGAASSTPPPTPAGSPAPPRCVLAGGRTVVIFQLQDDHSRLAVASLVAQAETSQAATWGLRQGCGSQGCAPAAADRQRCRPEPHPPRTAGLAGRARAGPGGRGHHLQTASNGLVRLKGISFLVSHPHARQRAAVTWDTERIIFSALDGEILAEHTWPEPSTTYVSTHTPDPTNRRGGRGHKKNPQLSPMS